MRNNVDDRIVKVSIEVNGKIRTYQDLAVTAQGMKYGNPNQNECTLRIANLKKEVRDYILTETSPFNKNRTPKSVRIEAGRQSYGTFLVYSGNVVSATPSQPPDVWLDIKCLTGNFQKGNIVSRTAPPVSSLKEIGKQVANDLSFGYLFQATDKNITNYNFTGGALNQINKLQEMGNIDAYVDNDVLTIKDANVPLNGIVQRVSEKNGLVGFPEITEQGVKIKFFLSPQTAVGGTLQLASEANPAANGSYVIYKLGFDISYRDDPFYWIAEGKRI